MKENNIIRRSIVLSRVIYWLCISLFAALLLVAIYWHIDAKAFSAVGISEFTIGYGINDFQLYSEQEIPADAMLLSELSHGMIYWIVIRGAFFFLVTLLIIRKMQSVLHSIENLKTFYSRNIKDFTDLARLGFVAFGVSCFNFSYLNGDLQVNVGLVLGPLIFGVACLVLAEVFKEGKALLEDKQMII